MTQELEHGTPVASILTVTDMVDSQTQDNDMATAKDRGQSLAALIKERNKLDDQIRAQRAEAVEEFKARVMAEAEELEVNLLELFQPPKKGRGKGVSEGPPKYMNPTTGETWSGRGRMASWMAKLVEDGKELEDYINPSWQKANE